MRNPLPHSHIPNPTTHITKMGNLDVNYWEWDCLAHRMEKINLKVKVEVLLGGRYLESPWTTIAAGIPLLPHSADQDWGEGESKRL